MARLFIATVLLASAAPLLAQSAPRPPAAPNAQREGKTFDRAEVVATVQAQFARRDENRDGFLTSDELGREQRVERREVRRAAPGAPRNLGETGALPRRDPGAAFDRIDANRDGMISRYEFANARDVRIEKRVVIDGQGQPAPPGQRKLRGAGGGMMGGAVLKLADADRDGRVSLAEATAGSLRQFDRMDVNRDGRLTPQERSAGRAQIRQMRRAG